MIHSLPEHLKVQWHPVKNNTHQQLNSKTKVWWLGECGHEWETRVSHRIAGSGCPYCSGNKVLAGFNDLKTTHPNIAAQWHPTKNTIRISTVTANTHSSAWWFISECSHEWKQSISSRVKNETCPVCKGKIIVSGVNDFKSKYPNIAAEWHPTKNLPLTPEKLSFGSGKKVWWLGACGHEWENSIHSRTGKDKTGCLVCSGRVLQKGINDLATTNPLLLSEWNISKNLPLTPDAVTKGIKTKIWWQCEKGHEWETALYNRTGPSSKGCPFCVNKISKAEDEIATFLEEKIKIERNTRSVLNNSELDIYIPEKKIAIEFNGLYWHSEEKGKHKYYHYNKWLEAKNAGIQLIQIWEDDWNNDPQLIKNMILHKLNISEKRPVYARNTHIEEITSSEAEEFLKNNHIQGTTKASLRIGLYTKNSETKTLVAVMLLKKESGEKNALNLLRFATSTTVVGGFTKILKYVEKEFTPTKIVTFSDNTISDGGLYKKTGFTEQTHLTPDYSYIFKGQRHHKFTYRIKRFKKDPFLVYKEGLTEAELAKLNNLPRIWDAGKIKWVKILKTD